MTIHRLNEQWHTATQLLAADYVTARKKLELTVRYNGSRTEYRYVVTINGFADSVHELRRGGDRVQPGRIRIWTNWKNS